jgi:hypothetical protein
MSFNYSTIDKILSVKFVDFNNDPVVTDMPEHTVHADRVWQIGSCVELSKGRFYKVEKIIYFGSDKLKVVVMPIAENKYGLFGYY